MTIFEKMKVWSKYHPATATLIFLCLIISLLTKLGRDFQFFHILFISEYRIGLPEIFSGQLWRLFSPIFIHFGILHITFNMLWLFQLGSEIEQRQSTQRIMMLVIVISFFSNLSQFYWQGPLFGGMSGVVYGLLGYVWAQGKYNHRSGLSLDRVTTVMMLVWFVICWLGLLGNIANMAHTIGLVCGVILGILYSPQLLRKFKFF